MSLYCSVQSNRFFFCGRFLRAKTIEVGNSSENLTFIFVVVYILCICNSFVFLPDLFDFRAEMLI